MCEIVAIQRQAVPLHRRRREEHPHQRRMPSSSRQPMGELAVQLRQPRTGTDGAVRALEQRRLGADHVHGHRRCGHRSPTGRQLQRVDAPLLHLVSTPRRLLRT